MATQGNSTSTVGEINVAIGADLTGLRSDLRQAHAEVRQFSIDASKAAQIGVSMPGWSGSVGAGGGVTGQGGAAAGAAGAVATAAGATGLRAWGQSLRNATAPLRAFQQGVQSFLSIGMRFLGWIGLAVTALQLFKSVTDRVTEPLRKMQAEVDAVAEKMAKLREEQSKLAAETVKEVTGAPQAEDMLEKLRKGVSDARRELERINEDIRKREAASKEAGQPQDHFNLKILAELYRDQARAKSNLILLTEREAAVAARSARAERDKTEAVQHRLELERAIVQTLRRASGQQSAMTERMAADISRMTSLLEIMVRQRVGR